MPDVIPDWRELHHFVVPFPILLLSIAPFLVIVGIGISVPKRRLFLGLALTFVVLGTEATFVAVATGEAAMNPVDPSPAFKVALQEHEALAKTTLELFSVLTLAFTALVFAPGCWVASSRRA